MAIWTTVSIIDHVTCCVCVIVNVGGAGEGELEVVLMTSCGTVRHDVKYVSNGVICVTFTPQTAEPHSAIVKFNCEMVPGTQHYSTPSPTFTTRENFIFIGGGAVLLSLHSF